MNKKEKQTLGSSIALLIIFGLFTIREDVVFLFPFLESEVFYIIVSIIIGIIVKSLILILIPNPKQKRNNPKKNTTKKVTKRNASKAEKTDNPYNVKSLDKLLKYDLKNLSGHDFEELCYQYFLLNNYKNVIKTPPAKDKGVDIIFVDDDGLKVAVQVKHRIQSKKDITVREINELMGAKRNHGCQKVMFITSTGYTRDARNLAYEKLVDIKGMPWVENKILRWRNEEAKKMAYKQ